MKKHLVKIARAILFMVGLLGILSLLSGFFKPSREGYNVIAVDAMTKELKTQKTGSVDLLFVGDSECYSSFSPLLLWKEQGYTSYVCGSAAQRLCDTYDLLEGAFELQTPKVVILETNCVFRFAGIEENPEDVTSNVLAKTFPVFKYHTKWKAYLLDNLLLKSEFKGNVEQKGFRIRTEVKPYKGGEYMKETTKVRRVPDISSDYLLKMKALCEANGAKLILVSAPSASNWNYKKHNGVEAWAAKNQVEYIDLNLVTDDIGIDWIKDTKDGGDHLNKTGAVKVTSYLGDVLKEKDILTDHRGDEYFADWASVK